MKRFLLHLAFLVTAVAGCKAQPPTQLSTRSKKAEKAYNKALAELNAYQYDLALADLAVAKKADPNFVEAYFLEANLYMEQQEWQKAIDDFKTGFSINPKYYPSCYFDCANAELKLGQYEGAKTDYQKFLDLKRNASQDMIDKTNLGIKCCDFALDAMQHPVPFKPVNMGPNINSDWCEYFPNVTADDQTFLVTRNQQKIDPNNGDKIYTQEDFYISYKNDSGQWSFMRNMGAPINTPENEGAPSLSPDGRFLFFAGCMGENGYGYDRRGYGSCDIFYTQKMNGSWTRPVNVGAPVNTKEWESQPSFSSDGKTLYFVSSRGGGYGDSDIWMSTLNDDGTWSEPVNLGDVINTPGKEEAVFIHPDNQTLYFASDGHVGMGGLDLYVSHRDSVTGKWGEPVNLGYPINTYGDESGLIVGGNGQIAYFSSDRKGGLGCDDIYSFELPKALQPFPVTYMKGKTFNKKTGAPVGAKFDLIDLATGKTFITSKSDAANGEFLVCLPTNKDYALNVNSPGFLFYSETFRLKESPDPDKPFIMNVPLQPIDTGAVVELKNVFFETGKFDLRPESKAELDKAVAWLLANPDVKVEISGHTDNVGDKKSNMTLSTNRAKAVYDYLVAHGVPASRMTYKGYGDTKPKVDNDTPEHRQMNRRVEMKITATK
ncbi:MAG TPA: OmpA family protein [Bacteroidia bacterium]|nr:OmpA family protein [Bacteroidia bacterium]